MVTESLIKKYLGFLSEEYEMHYCHQEFNKYLNFCGPVECYSFYNDGGCFTLHYLVQRGELGWFCAPQFSKDQVTLLNTELDQRQYISGNVFGYRNMLRLLRKCILRQITKSGSFFGITVVKSQ